jgi:serine/threonine protein kinase
MWSVRHFRPLKDYLEREHGVRGLQPVLAGRWHRGARYFKAHDANGEPLFIKMDGIYHLLDNEVSAWKHLRRTSPASRHFIAVRFFDFIGEYRLAAFEWVNAETLTAFLRRKPSMEEVQCVQRELLAIVEELHYARSVHRDFTLDNLLVVTHTASETKQGAAHRSVSVVLIDFAFTVIGDLAPHDWLIPLPELRDLCHGFKPGDFLWDDAFSCCTVLEQIEKETGIVDVTSRDGVARLIGGLTFSVDPLALQQTRSERFPSSIESPV